MGYGTFDPSASAARAHLRASSGTSAFAHSSGISSGHVAPKIHDSLNLSIKPRRECRDSDDSPVSVPIGIIVDVTGSMGAVAKYIIDSLHKIIPVIRDKGNVAYPSICFGAVGDVHDGKRGSLQLGEFEAHDELAETHLSNIWITGQGGGSSEESYDLAMYAFAHQVETDHWDKRGEKGLLFIIGDERFYPSSEKEFLKEFNGVDVQEDVPTAATAVKLQERWDVFIIRPGETSHWKDHSIETAWATLIPAQRIIGVENWDEVNSVIAGTVSVLAGKSAKDVMDDILTSGLKLSDATATALASVSNGDGLVSTGSAVGGSGSGSGERL